MQFFLFIKSQRKDEGELLAKITYYFGIKNHKQLKKITANPLFHQVVEYLTQQPNVILRQLKAAFEKEPHFDVFLDQLIKYELLERKNRRYTLKFPIFSSSDFAVPEEVILEIQQMKQEKLEFGCFLMGQRLWPLLFTEESYFFGVDSGKSSLHFLTKTEVGNETLSFISITPDDKKEVTAANYFSILAEDAEVPSTFQTLEHLIGDVDVDYFVLQTRRILRSLKRNNSKRNIFQEALVETGTLQKDEQGSYNLTLPVINKDFSIDIHTPQLQKLVHELNKLPVNQRMFFKKQLYSLLFHTYFPENSSISYIIN
jgi:hypothetical protein